MERGHERRGGGGAQLGENAQAGGWQSAVIGKLLARSLIRQKDVVDHTELTRNIRNVAGKRNRESEKQRLVERREKIRCKFSAALHAYRSVDAAEETNVIAKDTKMS